jgi:hypothetical protein
MISFGFADGAGLQFIPPMPPFCAVPLIFGKERR